MMGAAARWAGTRRSPVVGWGLSLAIPAAFAKAWWVAWGGASGPIGWLGTGAGLVVLLAVGTAAVTDAMAGKIHDSATLPAILWAFAINASGLAPGAVGAIGLGASLLGGASCFLLMAVAQAGGGAGGGDLKLMTALGLLLGWDRASSILFCGLVAGGLFVIGRSLWSASRPGPRPPLFAGRTLRIGPFIAIGAIAVLLVEARLP